MKTLIIALNILLTSVVISYAGDLNDLYAKDYGAFFKQWEHKKQQAITCKSAKDTALFLTDALTMKGNAEVSEANAEVIENLILTNPTCFLDGLHSLSLKKRDRILSDFVVVPTFKTKLEIEKALDKSWGTGNYQEEKQAFKKAQNTR